MREHEELLHVGDLEPVEVVVERVMGHVDPFHLRRWIEHGRAGRIVLPTVVEGGERMTTEAALRSWRDATSA